jgi:threonine dehydrogenase-like Zn-dependent dehydrogenase
MRYRAHRHGRGVGCGPVGQMSVRSAVLLGAKQVVAIDRVPERLDMAEAGGALPLNFEQESVIVVLNELTHGKGPEKCIDATGMESHVSLAQPDTCGRSLSSISICLALS